MISYIDLQDIEADPDISQKALQVLQYYNLNNITLICEVLGLMCDGQFREMQNYLREQSEDSHSINMVREIASFLYEFSKNHIYSLDTLQVFNQLVQALIEFCVGNYQNRKVVIHANITSVINHTLQIDISNLNEASNNGNTTIDYVLLRKIALEMKASIVQLLDTLLEEISNDTSKLSHLVAEGLDVSALHWSMLDFYVLKSDPDLIQLEYDDNASRALFDSYKIIMRLVDSGFAPLNTLSKRKYLRKYNSNLPVFATTVPIETTTMKAWEYCEQHSSSIEVMYKDDDQKEGVLTRVHFNINTEV